MSQPTLITNVRLVDGIHPPKVADVLMENGRFAAFANPGQLPATGARVVAGEGKFLVPGLWESHTHLMMGVDGSFAEKVTGVKAGLQTYLERGVTSVVDLGCPEDVMNAVRSELARQEAAYPAFYFAGPVFTGVNGWPLCMTCDHTSSWEIRPDSPVEQLVEGLADKTDFIKIIYDGLPGGTEKFPGSLMKRVIQAAHANHKKVMVHVRSKNDLLEAVRAGADCIEHIFQPENLQSLDEAEESARLMAEHQVFWCPTVVTYEQVGHLGSVAYLEQLREAGIITLPELVLTELNPFFHHSFPRISTAEALARVDYSLATLQLFAAAGVKLVAGSDIAIAMSRPAAVLRELQLFSRAGLDPAAIIRSATSNAAERLGQPSGAGTFTPGAAADALLVKEDPLVSIDALIRTESIDTVFRAGVPVTDK